MGVLVREIIGAAAVRCKAGQAALKELSAAVRGPASKGSETFKRYKR